MTQQVVIKEVAARDGLQAQPKHLTVEQRMSLLVALAQTGVPELEIGSFVSPKAVPQMAGTDEIAANLPPVDLAYSALVPNMKGYELAVQAGIRSHAIALAATEEMKSLEETLVMGEDILDRAAAEGVAVHAYLAVAFECPYEGPVSESLVLEQVDRLMQHSPARLVIADTIGAANPAAVQSMMQKLVDRYGPDHVGCHFHDTRAMGLANVYAALQAGVRQFDASAGGLGGCPFAPGAKGNVATEDVVMLCESMGYQTGIAMPKLLDAVALLSDMIGAPQGGRAHTWLTKQCA
jgi:hydroxymethylglutaryl-CoA lyase